ncbi:hypothetical protein OPKNFCMD_5987 [Methylobacterium crusticola]|uniref:Polysaccharide chain length determinant N-terminal domain-containing protein n=2 Tax=Methylobacterium crusticola TaxID=1697972 RepID=A0ABQ4R8J7_9HYPH|nr:exopolysaccharide transport family protein [Methylobacterium crusticola]GJD53215.1 hypothetical protein OPKNFCMD_5987 [Methylobacterium crusticola]
MPRASLFPDRMQAGLRLPERAADRRPRRGPDPGSEGRDGLTLGEVGRLLRRRWALIALPTLLAFCLAVVFVQVVPPRYTGEAKVLLESRDSAFTRPQQDRGEIPVPIDEQAVASQVQVVMSRDIAREAIKRLGLVGNREFDPMVDGPGPLQRLMVLVGLMPNPLERDPEDRVLEKYFERLLVYPAGKSRILTIEFRSRDPDLAARAANTIADLYLDSLAAAKVDTARYASTWLGSNVEALRTRVSEAEAKVEAFRARNGLIGGGTGNQPIGTQQLTELSTQLIQARAAQADAAAKAKLIKEMIRDGRAFEIPDVANNELIRRAVEQRMGLKAQLALEARTLLPQHPRIKELNAQLAGLETQIRGAADRTVRTLENDARIAGSRVESLQAVVDSQRDVVIKGNAAEVQLRALDREAKAQREQLESYLGRFREAAARDAASAAPADGRVVSRAVVPDLPSFPRKLPIVAFSTVVAFLFAAGAVVARALLAGDPPGRGRGRPLPALEEADDVAPRPRPVARTARPAAAASAEADRAPADAGLAPAEAAPAPAIAAPAPAAAAMPAPAAPVAAPPPAAPAPAARGGADRAGADAPYDLDALVARLAAVETAGDGRRVLLVGTGSAADLDGLARCLGRAVARRARALVVRLDRGGEGPHPGLTDLIAGRSAFRDAIQPDPGSRLHVIGRGASDPALLVSERDGLGLTLDALGETYDWVVCCLDDGFAPAAQALVGAVAAWMDAVVIATTAEADDARLVALFESAEAAGAPEVIVAQEHVPAPVAMPAYPLRRSA